jgi:hypothetical protein
MDKLYKIIVFFVGLIAMNISVQAQVGSVFSYFNSEITSNSDTFIANIHHTGLAQELAAGTDWPGKEVINFTNYPNPAITSTRISYTLTARASVNLRVIDLAGKQIAILIREEQQAGRQEYYWELAKNNVTSGMYILVLQVENKIYSRKIIVQ